MWVALKEAWARRRFSHWVCRGLRDQRGLLLAEALIAITAFALLGTAVLVSLQAGITARRAFEVDSLAENIVRNQLTYVLEQPYATPTVDCPWIPCYDQVDVPAGFVVTTNVLCFDDGAEPPCDPKTEGLSRIVITVSYNGRTVQTLETVRISP